MLIVDLLIPAAMIGFGHRFRTRPSERINRAFGYRTARSMKTKDTWVFAHEHCGRVWLRLGSVLLPLSVLALLPFFGKEVVTVSIAGGIVCCVQVAFLVAALIPTELALKRTFDANGKRK